jgi:hypothetical protein
MMAPPLAPMTRTGGARHLGEYLDDLVSRNRGCVVLGSGMGENAMAGRPLIYPKVKA